MKITNIHPRWGSIIEFNNPIDFFKQDKSHWKNLIYNRKLLVFKRMTFDLIDYMKFGHHFGTPWTADAYYYSHEVSVTAKDVDGTEYVSSKFSNKITNINKIPNTEMAWHADIPNRRIKPFPHRSLWIVKNPNPEFSGKTKWLNIDLDCCEQYLTDELKALLPRVTIQQQSWYTPGTDLQMHNFVKIHPVTGQRSLRLNYYNDPHKGRTGAWIKNVYIDGQEQSDCSLIQQYIDCLLKHEELFYCHQWDDMDLIIYDNYSFIHNRTALVLGEDTTSDERMFYRTNIDHEV
jgi:alpha-ketoglutarate-dependent taurine dioxygenase